MGGGFTAAEYKNIATITEGKWHAYDPKNPPVAYIELAGAQKEIPDVWIKPVDSIVIEVKASAVIPDSDRFRMNTTLRFPRFRRLRMDKSYETSLSIKEFLALSTQIESEKHERDLELENHRRTPKREKRKFEVLEPTKPTVVSESMIVSDIFQGQSFYLILESRKRAKLENDIASNHGELLTDRPTGSLRNAHVIADSNLTQAAPLKKEGKMPLVKSIWISDCLFNARVLPYESRHLFFAAPPKLREIAANQVDPYGDSYGRQIENVSELQQVYAKLRF